MRARLGAAVLLALHFAAGCGDGGSGVATAPSTSAAASSKASVEAAPLATASAEAMAPSANVEASAPSPSASAPPSGSAAAKPPPLPKLASDPPSDEKTPRPSEADWKRAPEVELSRNTSSTCSARRLREWLRVTCKDLGWGVHGVSLIAGTREGIDMGLRGGDRDGAPPDLAFAVFPLRRGDRRLLQFSGRNKWGWSPSEIVSEHWLAGDPAPFVTLESP